MRTAALAVLLAACGAAGQDRATLDSIPRPAAAALTAEAGTATIQHVSREIEGGRELYEGSWVESGLEREAKVTASGELVELEIEVREADVPAPVRSAAASALTGATKIKYVRLTGDRFEAEATIGGKEREVTLTASGAPATGDGNEDGDDDGDESDD